MGQVVSRDRLLHRLGRKESDSAGKQSMSVNSRPNHRDRGRGKRGGFFKPATAAYVMCR